MNGYPRCERVSGVIEKTSKEKRIKNTPQVCCLTARLRGSFDTKVIKNQYYV